MTTFEERRKQERVKPPWSLSAFAENQLSQVIDISANGLRLKGTFFEAVNPDYKLKLFTDFIEVWLSEIIRMPIVGEDTFRNQIGMST